VTVDDDNVITYENDGEPDEGETWLADPQPPFCILGRERSGDRLFNVLDGDQPDQMIALIDH